MLTLERIEELLNWINLRVTNEERQNEIVYYSLAYGIEAEKLERLANYWR